MKKFIKGMIKKYSLAVKNADEVPSLGIHTFKFAMIIYYLYSQPSTNHLTFSVYFQTNAVEHDGRSGRRLIYG